MSQTELRQAERVPSPADAPTLSAADLIARIRRAGGRVHRTQAPGSVFVLTTDPRLAAKLQRLGASTHLPAGLPKFALDEMGNSTPPGGYRLARDSGRVEWDLWINRIPVLGEQTIWEAASP